jgi:hypothetical protein
MIYGPGITPLYLLPDNQLTLVGIAVATHYVQFVMIGTQVRYVYSELGAAAFIAEILFHSFS